MKLIVGVALALATVIPSVGHAQDGPEVKNIKIAAAAAVVSYVSPYIAESKGFFKDEGLNVSISNFQSGVKALQSVLGGSAQVGVGSYGHMITMVAKGQNMESFVSYLRCPGYAVLVRNGVKASSIKDLKGMKIGVTSPGSSTDQSMKYLMVKAGLSPDNFTPVAVGNSAGSVAAVENGAVDATIVVEPIASQLLAHKYAHLLVDMRTSEGNNKAFGGPYPEGSLYATDQFINQNPKTIQALTNAVVRANKWIQKSTPEEIVKALPPGYVGDNKALFEQSLKNIHSCMSPDGLTDPKGAKQVFNIMATFKPSLKTANVDLSKTYTNKFVEEALKTMN